MRHGQNCGSDTGNGRYWRLTAISSRNRLSVRQDWRIVLGESTIHSYSEGKRVLNRERGLSAFVAFPLFYFRWNSRTRVLHQKEVADAVKGAATPLVCGSLEIL